MPGNKNYDRQKILSEIGEIICFGRIITKNNFLDPKAKYFKCDSYLGGIVNYLSSKIPMPYCENAPIRSSNDLEKSLVSCQQKKWLKI